MSDAQGSPMAPRRKSILDWIEWLGNQLPEPAILFASLAALVIVCSGVGAALNWKVDVVKLTIEQVDKLDDSGKPVLGADGTPVRVNKLDAAGRPVVKLENTGTTLEPRSLMTVEGLYWMLSSMVRNFTGLPALGLIFTGMLGIGLAEKFGLFSALMRWVALATPRSMLTPMVVFIGANSSVASDAGYIILPPLAAALYAAVGRSPIAGLAAAFAGVAGGFGGGLFPTAADAFLAGVATTSAQIIDAGHPAVDATHNLYFKAASAFVVMLCGWWVTDKVVEPRLRREVDTTGFDTSAIEKMALTGSEKKGLILAGGVAALVLGAFFAMVLIPGAPLHGVGLPRLANQQVPATVPANFHTGETTPAIASDRVIYREAAGVEKGTGAVTKPEMLVEQTGKATLTERPGDRWSQVIVPLILIVFLLPGMAYGFVTGTLRSQKDFIDALYHGIRSIVPVLVIAFFLGQFVNYFSYTGLDRMLAYSGGQLLVRADLPVPLLLALFVLVVIAGDFAMSGMLSKFGVMAPIFIPMFMMVGMSPELTTAAYRIGDSVVNIITPLNSYLLIILAVLTKYKKDAGLGSLISLMLPYSVVFGIAWTGFLILWWFTGLPLGTDAPLTYVPQK
jgi:aminobenzoyl-glutamate transport protein